MVHCEYCGSELEGAEEDEDVYGAHEAECEYQMTFHPKWVADGAKTVEEAAARMNLMAMQLQELAGQGWTLQREVDNGFIFAGRLLENVKDL
jgi:hypothetical protein